jgi:hypothetical protein
MQGYSELLLKFIADSSGIVKVIGAKAHHMVSFLQFSSFY